MVPLVFYLYHTVLYKQSVPHPPTSHLPCPSKASRLDYKVDHFVLNQPMSSASTHSDQGLTSKETTSGKWLLGFSWGPCHSLVTYLVSIQFGFVFFATGCALFLFAFRVAAELCSSGSILYPVVHLDWTLSGLSHGDVEVD